MRMITQVDANKGSYRFLMIWNHFRLVPSRVLAAWLASASGDDANAA
jgi:hypothetical protein